MPSNEIMSMEGQLVGLPLAGPETFSQQQLDYLKRALGVDETVLWEGAGLFDNPSSVTISESVENFEYVRFEGYNSEVPAEKVVCFGKPTISGGGAVYYCRHSNIGAFVCYSDILACSSTTVSVTSHKHCWFQGSTYNAGPAGIVITKIVGCKRIAGGN